jgi:hypothetical protein
VKQLLGYDYAYRRIPILLSRGSIFAPNVRNLGFVGFYEGPFWGIMELQSRLLVETWASEELNHNYQNRTGSIFKSDDAAAMREALDKNPLAVPQFWMGDYVGLLEELSRGTGSTRDDASLGHGKGPAFPSRYFSGHKSAEASAVVNEVAEILEASSSKAKFVPAAVFRGLQGVWSLQRTIEVHGLPSAGGSFVGIAYFHPRIPTSGAYISEYLYVEEGTFTNRSGVSAPISRRYVYRYDEPNDTIATWLTAKDGKTAAAQCMSWSFEAPPSVYTGWVANGGHRCARDFYKENGQFTFDGAYLERFILTTSVDGPSKKYVHVSLYVRPEN